MIVEAGSVLDARHVAILAAAGTAADRSPPPHPRRDRSPPATNCAVRGSRSTLVRSTTPTARCLPPSSRDHGSMIVTSQHVDDEIEALAGTLHWLAGRADVIVSTGGAAGSDTDHTARAIAAAGGRARPLRVALRPGKPIVVGTDWCRPSVLGLPGNPVAAIVNFLLFGRALILGVRRAKSNGHAARPARRGADRAHAGANGDLRPRGSSALSGWTTACRKTRARRVGASPAARGRRWAGRDPVGGRRSRAGIASRFPPVPCGLRLYANSLRHPCERGMMIPQLFC